MRIRSMALAVACCAVVMDPGAVLADVGHLDQVGIEPLRCGRLAEGLQVHVRRAGGDDDAGQPLGGDLLANQRLARVGAHVLVGRRADHAGQLGGRGRGLLHVDVAGDVLAAPADKYADPRHAFLPFHHKMPVDAQRPLVEAQGQAHQVGKIIHRPGRGGSRSGARSSACFMSRFTWHIGQATTMQLAPCCRRVARESCATAPAPCPRRPWSCPPRNTRSCSSTRPAGAPSRRSSVSIELGCSQSSNCSVSGGRVSRQP